MRRRTLIPICAWLLCAGVAACGTMRFRFIDQGDRPPGTDYGLPPPAAEVFEPCWRVGNMVEHLDTNGDGKVDTVRVSTPKGDEVCRGVDSNHDGKLDTWDVVKDGKVVQRAHDSDGDGKVDQHWTWPVLMRPGCGVMQQDKDGDGRPDPGTPKYDPCGILGETGGVVPLPASMPLGPRKDP